MTDSIRQQIIDKVDARLKLILTTGGYKTNAGAHVYDWLNYDQAKAQLPSITYRDPENLKTAADTKNWDNDMTMELEARAAAGVDAVEDLREIVEDIYKAIGTDEKWSELAKKTIPVSEEMDVKQGDQKIALAKVTIRIKYTTTKWQY